MTSSSWLVSPLPGNCLQQDLRVRQSSHAVLQLLRAILMALASALKMIALSEESSHMADEIPPSETRLLITATASVMLFILEASDYTSLCIP